MLFDPEITRSMQSQRFIESSGSTQPVQTTTKSLLIVAATGLGKAQPLTSKILTPTGWVAMGEARPGMEIVRSDGTTGAITGVFPQGKKRVYAVTFSDGAVVECCGEHLWSVQTKSQKHRCDGFVTKTTDELRGDVYDGSGARKWFLPAIGQVDYASSRLTGDLPIDPYVIGAMIGDGGYSNGLRFSSADQFIVDKMAKLLPSHCTIDHVSGYDYVIHVGRKRKETNLRSVLGRKLSHEKRIPREYLFASIEDRLSLLRGLMDTDGTVGDRGYGCEFNTTSKQLAHDVCELVRGLGGVTSVRTRKGTSYTHNNEVRRGRTSYRVKVNTIDNPFSLPRKAERFEIGNPVRTKAIVSIEEVGEAECQCISVDAPDQLYVTDGFTLTHNTVIMAELAKTWPIGRVMLVSHRFELNQQAMKTLESITGEEVDLEQADFRADQRADLCRVVVASVQTLNSKRRGIYRMDRFDPNEFGLLLIDEAHHAAAATYRRIIRHFQQNPALRIVGVTATPDRLDGIGLGHVFEDVVCNYDLRWGVENGWLVEPRPKFVMIEGMDLDSVRSIRGDLDRKQLAQLVEKEAIVHQMARPLVDFCQRDKQAIVFASSVAHAQALSHVINAYHEDAFGEPGTAVSIDQSLKPSDPMRQRIVQDFRDGKIQYLCNYGVATEGFDAPGCSVVAIGRPTQSRALYTQMVGRGGRALPGVVDGLATVAERHAAIAASAKPYFTILNFCPQNTRHSLASPVDVLGGMLPKPIKERALTVMKKRDFDGSAVDAIEEAKRQLAEEEAARKAAAVAEIQYTLLDGAEPYDVSIIPEGRMPWYTRAHAVTEKQRWMLLKLGYTTAQIEAMNKRKASGAIDYAIRNPITKFGLRLKNERQSRGEL